MVARTRVVCPRRCPGSWFLVPGCVLCNMSNSFFPGRGLQPLPPTRRCLTLVALFLHHVWHPRVRAPLSATLAPLCGKIHVSKIFHLDGTVLFVLTAGCTSRQYLAETCSSACILGTPLTPPSLYSIVQFPHSPQLSCVTFA